MAFAFGYMLGVHHTNSDHKASVSAKALLVKEQSTQTGPIDELVQHQDSLYHKHKKQIELIKDNDSKEALLKELESPHYPLLFAQQIQKHEDTMKARAYEDFKFFKTVKYKHIQSIELLITALLTACLFYSATADNHPDNKASFSAWHTFLLLASLILPSSIMFRVDQKLQEKIHTDAYKKELSIYKKLKDDTNESRNDFKMGKL